MIKEYNKDTVIDFDNCILFFSNSVCAPCEVLESILKEFENVMIYKINIDKYLDVAKNYDVTSLPTLKLFRKTINVYDIKGVRNSKDIRNILKYYDMI